VGPVGRWVSSRQGVVALVVAVLFVAATTDGGPDVLTSPLRFVLAFAAAFVAASLLARWWEERTWPEAPAFARRAGAAPAPDENSTCPRSSP